MDDLSEVLSEENADLAQQFKNVDDLAKSYKEARKNLSSTARVPGQDAPQEEWQKFYQRLGAPEAVDGYPLPDTEDKVLGGILDNLRGVAFQHGISKSAWESIASKASELSRQHATSLQEKLQESRSSWEDRLKKDLGDNYESIVGAAQRAQDSLLGEDEELKNLVEGLGLDKHPSFVRLFTEVAKVTGNDKLPNAQGGPDDGSATARSLGQEWLKLQNSGIDSRHPAYERSRERQAQIQKELSELGYNSVFDVLTPEDYVTQQQG